MMYEQDANQKAHPLTMAGNRHYAKARDVSGPNRLHAEARATEATLAVAFEQRTANLIAVFGNMMDGEVDTFLGERIDGYELAKTIQARLGL